MSSINPEAQGTALSCIFTTCVLTACGAGTQPSATATAVDPRASPALQFRIDAFSVPAQSWAAVEHKMHQNSALLAKQSGFKGHVAFEKASGPTTFNLVTIAAWDSLEAMNSAGDQVREDNRRAHFDMQAMMAQWGITASIGAYRMLPDSSRATGALLQADPNLRFRIDAFSVPAASRSEFDAAMHDNTLLLEKLSGFNGHVVFEKTSGPTTFNVVTVAVWDSEQAMRSAGDKVREDYERKGFDMQSTIARWGVTASLGGYRAPVGLQ